MTPHFDIKNPLDSTHKSFLKSWINTKIKKLLNMKTRKRWKNRQNETKVSSKNHHPQTLAWITSWCNTTTTKMQMKKTMTTWKPNSNSTTMNSNTYNTMLVMWVTYSLQSKITSWKLPCARCQIRMTIAWNRSRLAPRVPNWLYNIGIVWSVMKSMWIMLFQHLLIKIVMKNNSTPTTRKLINQWVGRIN